jgi:hypothetical protein
MISVIQLDLILSRSRSSFIFQELIYKTTYENILKILKAKKILPKKITILATNGGGAGGGQNILIAVKSPKNTFFTKKSKNILFCLPPPMRTPMDIIT